jgi:hypothetical protein
MGAGNSESLEEALRAIASPERGEAAGFAAALACAEAAALVELTASLAARRLDSDALRDLAEVAGRLRAEALEVAELERTAWADAKASGRPELAIEPARRALALASGVSEGAATVVQAGDWPFTPDARAAGVLADAAGAVAALVLAANGEPGDGA